MASRESVRDRADEADVVARGCGVAGMVAAMEVGEVDRQASVLILEKMAPAMAGGNSRVSGRSLSFPTDMADYRRYQEALNHPHPIPDRLMRAWVEGRTGQKEWVRAKADEAGFELGPWSAVAFALIRLTIGLRVSQEAEREGLDLREHGERGYNF